MDIFGFVFESKGADKVKSDLKGIKNAEKSTEKATDDLAKSVGNLLASYVGFKKILSEVMGIAKGGEDLRLLANNAGIGAEQLERYGIALQNYGGGLSSASSAISHLNQMMQDLRFGNGGALQESALRYGISIDGKNGLATGEEMLYNIARRMERIGAQEQLDLGRKLGLDPSMIALLRQGVAGLNSELERASRLTIYSPEDIENSRKFQLALREFNLAVQKIWATLSRYFLPTWTKVLSVVGNFVDYLSQHKGFVIGFFTTLSAILAGIAIKSAVAFAPIYATIGAIVALGSFLGLLYDDFITYLEGGESALGWFWEACSIVFGAIIDIVFGFLEAVKMLPKAVSEVVAGVITAFLMLKDGLASVFSWIESKVSDLFGWMIEVKNAIGDLFGSGNNNWEVNMQKARQLYMDTHTPLASAGNSYTNMTGGNNSVKIDTVNVNTQATDAKGISQGIGGALADEFQDVLYQNTGGALA